MLLEVYNGKTDKGKSLFEAVAFNNAKVQGLLGKGYSPGTLRKYLVFANHLKKFLEFKYNVSDMPVKDLKFSFITDFEYFLITNGRMKRSTAGGILKKLMRVIRICIENDWLKNDPFASYKVKMDKVDRDFLSESEIQAIQNKRFSTERLEQVKDVFLFACYTGLAFSDLQKLNRDHVVRENEQEKIIQIARTKTGTTSTIPLLGIPEQIITKYVTHPRCERTGRLLPVMTNQKMNEYLKEIADICGTRKTLTSHVARHTFATTITLSNHIPIETVSRMLGHTSIRTTQIYARVVNDKIVSDMAKISAKYSHATTI